MKNDCEIFLLIQLRQCSYHLLGMYIFKYTCCYVHCQEDLLLMHRSTLLLPFGGSLVPAHRLLYLFLLEVHRSRWSYHQQDKSLASNSVESFGISLTAGF